MSKRCTEIRFKFLLLVIISIGGYFFMKKIFLFFKKYMRFLGLIFLLVVLFFCLFGNYEFAFASSDDSIKLKSDEVISENKEKVSEKKEEPKNEDEIVNNVYVDVKGEVKKPGTYVIAEDKRVIDVIKLAGGLTNNADTRVNNLSLKVKDEMVIVIYSKSEVKDFDKTKKIEEDLYTGCVNSAGVKNDACIGEGEAVSFPISLNNATLEELLMIPKIGESKAKLIIEYRNKNGSFKSIEELKEISGIGDTIYESIKEYFKL